jgi:hypothetical protein
VESVRQRALTGGAPASLGSQRAVVARAVDDASVSAFRISMLIVGGLMAVGGVLSAVGIENPRRRVPARECPGGAAVGASADAGHVPLAAGATATH